MSRPSDHARLTIGGVLLSALELLSMAAVAHWPSVDDRQPPRVAAPEPAMAGPMQRATGEADVDETQASLLLGLQVLDRVQVAFDAGARRGATVRLDRDWHARDRARGPFAPFCRPHTPGCD
jgi:hypothetical protein